MGKLERPRVKIEDKDNDRAHKDREAPKVVKFMFASPADHSYLVEKTLKPNQGIAHGVFIEKESPAEKEAAAEGNEGEEGEKSMVKDGPPKDELMDILYHIYVPEVVREPAVHFYRVPRLGAMLAVPLEYNSCLSEKALDQSIIDYQAYLKAVEEQAKLKRDWDEETERIREEKEKAGESFFQDERVWPAIEEQPFLTKKKQFVVILDTLGQDREFTVEQRRFALDTVKNFAGIWERRDAENLTTDRNLRLQMAEMDKEYVENQIKKFEEDAEEHVKNVVEGTLQTSNSQQRLATEESAGHEKQPD